MSRLFLQRLSTIYRVTFEKGISGLIRLIKAYFFYQLKEKWEFVYFQMKVTPQPYNLPKLDESIVFRIATKDDITLIKRDVYPCLGDKQQNDKRYIESIDSQEVKCFIAERDQRIIHYALLFEIAKSSPLMQTPIISNKINLTDSYLGSVFTVPRARGLWIVPHSILNIFSYLASNTNSVRLLAIVHKDTPGSVGFYKRLGFDENIDFKKKDYLNSFRNFFI